MAGFALALAAALAAVLAGFGSRWGLWEFRAGFTVLKWASFAALAAAAVSLAGVLATRPGGSRRGMGFALLGLLVGLGTAYVPWSWKRTAERVPPIHDITTDMADPPGFVAIAPLREGAANPMEYGGAELAAQQRAGYPDIEPLTLNIPPVAGFDRALKAAREMDWAIVAADSAAGRIEATDTTFWFGFKDDVVIRVTPFGGGSRIDVRSVSRVGKSDVGTNATRIRAYLEKLAATG
ncbi:MAG: DUF1499 domain-containing protein [Gemmatimonadota bacterium]